MPPTTKNLLRGNKIMETIQNTQSIKSHPVFAVPDTSTIYCPFCAKHIIASNIPDVQSGYHTGYIFSHDDVYHPQGFQNDAAMHNNLH